MSSPTPGPAPAILASTLLSLESSSHHNTPPPPPYYPTGIPILDSTLSPSLWTTNKVIAIITNSPPPSTPSSQSAPNLPAHLIATHLSSSSSSPTKTNAHAAVYIIAPPNTPIAANIHALLSTPPHHPHPNAPLQLLDRVSILQYLDIAGLSESIAEVSSALDSNPKDDSTNPLSSHPIIILISALHSSLSSVQRRHGLVQACALGAGLLRSLAHLAAAARSALVLLSLEGNGGAREWEGGLGLGSAFARKGRGGSGIGTGTGAGTWAVPGGGGGALGKVIMDGVDTAVLVRNDGLEGGGGQVVVEVVKDRTGGGLGCWAVWKEAGG